MELKKNERKNKMTTLPQAQSSKNQPVHIELLKHKIEEMAAALPSYMDPERMLRIVTTEFRKTPKLAECTPQSFCTAVIQSAQMGLEPGMFNEAWLIPYGKECTLQTGYMGLVKCVMRSNDIEYIYPYIVYEGDIFEEELGAMPNLKHKPMHQVNAKATHYYAVAKYKTGAPVWEVMSVDQIVAHKEQYARGWQRKDSAWQTNFDGMAKKTVLKQVCKYLPKSVELNAMLNNEQRNADIQVETIRVDAHEKLQEADDVPNDSDLKVEKNKFQAHMKTIRDGKIDVEDILKDGNAVKELLDSSDVLKIRAINDVLDQKLMPL